MSRITLWLFVIALGIDVGAGLYETRIVVPLWSSGVPGTLAAGNAYARVAIDAGMRFWALVTPVVGLLALATLVTGLRWPHPQLGWRIAACVAELAAFAMTMLYFRPTLERLFMGHGAGLPRDAIEATVRHWVRWGWLRVGISVFAWCAALAALGSAAEPARRGAAEPARRGAVPAGAQTAAGAGAETTAGAGAETTAGAGGRDGVEPERPSALGVK